MSTKGTNCWNCGRIAGTFRSKRSGIEYCAGCGAAMEGTGWISAKDVMFGMTRTDLPDDASEGLSVDERAGPDVTEEPE